MPAIRDVISYSEPRMLSTLIVSGAKAPWQTVTGVDDFKTKIGAIPSSQLIGDNAYRYNIMGRIQQASVINSQIGSSGSDGTFQLSLKDQYLYEGMNVSFGYARYFQARVMSGPSGGPNNWVYSFQSVDGTLFNYATMVTPQAGEKTCFGAFTSYGERSLRGFGRTHYPQQFINHLGIQRKTIAISGSALTDVIWTMYAGKKGWFYEKERQARLQFMMEDEHNKWFGRSTMKDQYGNLRQQAFLQDTKGDYITTGDGIIPQLEGGNEQWGSATNGMFTLQDFKDMMKTLKKKSTALFGNRWVVVTGSDGYSNAQEVLQAYWIATGGRIVQNQKNGGGADIEVGNSFDTFNFEGNSITFVQHPMFDDEQRFPLAASDGGLYQSGMYIFIDMGINSNGVQNMEILSKGAYGINRSMNYYYLDGVTGEPGITPVSSIDAKEFNMIKEDGIFIYNTTSCGIGYRSAA